MFGCHRHCGGWDIDFSSSRDLARPRNEKVIWQNKQERIKLSYYPAKFGVCRYSGSENIVI